MEETQWAVHNPFWAVAIGVLFLLVGVAAWQAHGQPGTLLGLSIAAAILGVSAFGHLHARIEGGFLRIRFFPLFVRRIPVEDILGYAQVVYRPMQDFGGWGVRFGRGGVAHTVGGDQAVLLRLSPHRDLYLGTRRPEAWAAALQAAGVAADPPDDAAHDHAHP